MTFRRLKIGKLAAAAVIIGLQTVGLTATPAQATEEAMLIIDASRSMWGQIKGKNRVVIARKVFEDIFQRHQNRLKLGITAYGNRSRSSCQDINQIKPIGQIDAAEYSKAVNRINPRGKTPISRALELTARKLDYRNKKTTLILMSDGLDNCRSNPCEMAKNLEKNANFLTIHVIAFSVPKEDHASLSCIANNTGGKFFTARNRAELTAAFDKVFNTITTPAAVFAHVPIPKAAPNNKPNTLETDKIAAIKEDTDAETKNLMDAMKARAQTNTDTKISRNAEVRSTTTKTGNGKIIKIARTNPADTKNSAPVYIENPMKPSVMSINKDTPKGAEAVELMAKLASDSPPLVTGIKWEIYKFAKPSRGNRAQIATSDDAQPTVFLSPGKYIVRVVYGTSSTAKVLRITGGQITVATFILNAGGLRVKSRLIAGSPPSGQAAQQWLYLVPRNDSSKSPKLVTTANNPKQIHQLTAGTYELISKYGTANAIVKTNVIITPGLLTDVEVNHKAGIVKFQLVKRRRGGEELSNVTWKLFDIDGNEIIDNPNASSGEIIAPGKYQISAEYEGVIYTKVFEIIPGKSTVIQVVKR